MGCHQDCLLDAVVKNLNGFVEAPSSAKNAGAVEQAVVWIIVFNVAALVSY